MPEIEVITEGDKFIQFGACRPWLPAYQLINCDWIKWLKRASRKKSLFVGLSDDGYYFLGSWVVGPDRKHMGFPCFQIIEQLGRTPPDHPGDKEGMPSSYGILSKLFVMEDTDRQIKQQADRRWRDYCNKVERNNRRKAEVVKHYSKLKNPKWKKFAAGLEMGLGAMEAKDDE